MELDNQHDTETVAPEQETTIDNNDANHKRSVIPERPVVNTAHIVSEPNFDALAVTQNTFSDGAEPPPLPEGAPVSAPRGRPATMTPEQRAERKKQRDREYRENKKPASKKAATVDAEPRDRTGTAELVVSSVDFILGTISNGEFSGDTDIRREYVQSIARYLEVDGRELPPWAEVCLMTGVYGAGAFRSPTFVERMGFAYLRVKKYCGF